MTFCLMTRYIALLCMVAFLLLPAQRIMAQVSNDDCSGAIPIPNTNNYCSKDGEFTNTGATPDPAAPNNGCISVQFANGVWFSFRPKEPAVLIRVFGLGQGGTLRNPKILVYESCGKYLRCSPGKSVGTDELVIDNLTIGQTYYIMIESTPGGEGRFGLCIDDFVPVPSPESDCVDAVVLCSKDPFKVQAIVGSGSDRNEIEPGNCLFGGTPNAPAETASTWYKWTCDKPGTLTFTLTPNDYQSRTVEAADLDFALYELPGGLDDCRNKLRIRCVAAGGDIGFPLAAWADCNGPTGLRAGETDTEEKAGCKLGGNNNNGFVSPINMVSGKSYVLIVNNYSGNGQGFSIEFGGTGTFLGPEPNFEVNANQTFECDKTVVFKNQSNSATDPIVGYSWSFGDRAIPATATGVGPFDVNYASFGEKIAALTVESSRGCKVTKILDLFVQPCCKDTSTLDLGARVVDVACFNEKTGEIVAGGIRGALEYSYSLEGGPFRSDPRFTGLAAGDYKVVVRDIKGCTDSINTIIDQQPPIVVDAGMDQEIDLGNTTILNGTYSSRNGASLNWTPDADFDINGVPNPEVFPKKTTTYVFSITDDLGCTEQDSVTIRVKKDYKVTMPNIFTPDGNGTNEFFNIWVNNSVEYVAFFEVYDRWGNLVFQGTDTRAPGGGALIVNDINQGWDGTFQGRALGPGVYVWRASVRYIDDAMVEFAGDLLLVR